MLQITQRRQEGTLIAVYTGELDHHAARAAIEQTEDLLVLFPCEKLVLDLSELTFMDSSGRRSSCTCTAPVPAADANLRCAARRRSRCGCLRRPVCRR